MHCPRQLLKLRSLAVYTVSNPASCGADSKPGTGVDVYRSPAFHAPSVRRLGDICTGLGIDAEPKELAHYRDVADSKPASHVTVSEPAPGLDVYTSPAFHTPSVRKLGDICSKLGIDVEDEELTQYRDVISGMEKNYGIIDRMREPTLPVKYPRTPGYRPSKEENPLNAWYWKSTIKGASSGKLRGKTIAVKDSICVAGVPMMNGSRVLEGYVPEVDATVVTRVLDEGGTILGKSTSEHFCYSVSSHMSDKGAVPNPHDQSRSAGGSSSGSAVLVSTGEVDMALGGDQGGSIRVPACHCGIVGLKPTYGLVPYTGAASMLTNNDHLGPMTRSVRECALLLEVLAGYDEGLDCRQKWPLKVPRYTELLTDNLNGLRIGIVKEGFLGRDAEVDRIVLDAGLSLVRRGATVDEISVPEHRTAFCIWFVLGTSGAYEQSVLNYGHAIGSGKGFHPTSLAEATARGFKTRINDLSPFMKLNCIFGEFMKQDYNNHYFYKASNLIRTARDAYDDVFKKYDVIIMPTVPVRAPKLVSANASTKENIAQTVADVENTAPFNITGHPAISFNAGYADGLPVGMMVAGRHFEDSVVLNVAHNFEQLSMN